MRKYSSRVWVALLVTSLAVVRCNLPAAAPQTTSEFTATPVQDVDVAGTAAQLALTMAASAMPSPTATQVSPIATQCYPMVTANMNANVRTGPGTDDYDVIGYIPTGGTAPVAGQNDNKTWWYIEFAGGSGGHAWVAGSVTTAACLPAVVQVVAAPPLPPTATFIPLASDGSPTPVGKLQIQVRMPTPTKVWSPFRVRNPSPTTVQ